MTKRVTRATSDPTLLLVLAAIGLVGLLVSRRYGLAPVLRTVNQALRIARVVRRSRSAARATHGGATHKGATRKRPARRVRPKVLAFSNRS
jgi:hypothetical protein